MKRRDVLRGLGGLAGGVGLAGCLGGPGAGTPTKTAEPDTPVETPDPTDSGDHPVTPTETSFEIVERTCGSAENTAAVSFGEDSVRVEGTIGGRDTCDTARLVEASLHLDVLKVVVEVVQEDTEGTPVCGQCLTDIDYAFSASGLRGGPAQVRVVHLTADGKQTVTVVDRS